MYNISNVTILNATPHEVAIVDEHGNVKVKYPNCGFVARAKQQDEVVGEINGITIVRTVFGEVEGLPEFQKGIFYIVSLATAKAAEASGRTTEDLLLTSGPKRDENGRIIGCERFAQL